MTSALSHVRHREVTGLAGSVDAVHGDTIEMDGGDLDGESLGLAAVKLTTWVVPGAAVPSTVPFSVTALLVPTVAVPVPSPEPVQYA